MIKTTQDGIYNILQCLDYLVTSSAVPPATPPSTTPLQHTTYQSVRNLNSGRIQNKKLLEIEICQVNKG